MRMAGAARLAYAGAMTDSLHLRDFDPAAFLRDYWQKKPLLIRNAWQHWRNPLGPDELAGLACEEGIEARLVVRGDEDWAVEHGPLDAARFAELGDQPWTLLVNAVDHHVPEVAALIEPFRFVPNWRIDDVMVSYATEGGGVGPHFDQYDVFLVQGLGKRRWQTGANCDSLTELRPHDELRLLARFEPVNDWVLEPGDILYVPPRLAHDGVAASGDCMTYSIGFRAPSLGELVAHFGDDVLERLRDEDRYGDPDLMPQANPGEIEGEAIDRLHAMLKRALDDRRTFAHWFGRYMSTPKYPEEDFGPEAFVDEDEVKALAEAGTPVIRNPASRFSFFREADVAVLLFVDGECIPCAGPSAALAEAVCAQAEFGLEPELAGDQAACALLARLVNQGSLAFADED